MGNEKREQECASLALARIRLERAMSRVSNVVFSSGVGGRVTRGPG